MIVLDTDCISLAQWGGAGTQRLLERLEREGFERPPTTIITSEEQIRGWMGKIARTNSVADEVRLYAKLSEQLKFFGSVQILEFSEKAAVEFQRLRGLKVRIGTMDLKIAAIALANEATLWTRNLVDFRKVPGLKVEDAAGS